jgi:hypothetical protein
MGALRKLQVETWAVLGLADDASRRAEAVNACAAYEHAYHTIIVLDAETYCLCRALGLPVDKLRRWGENSTRADETWDRCPPLSISPRLTSAPQVTP